MAENQYKSLYTGEQVDQAVGAVLGTGTTENTNLVTAQDIVQNQGSSARKIMSQAAVTAAFNNVPSQDTVSQMIENHNTSETAHQDIRQEVAAKPDALNERGTSQTNTYSQNYINQNFVGITLASKLYATRETDTTANITTTMPILDASNYLIVEDSTNTEFNSTADFFFTRSLEAVTVLSNTSSFTLTVPFILSGSGNSENVSFAAKLSVSTDNGSTWTDISTRQAYGAMTYDIGAGNTAIMEIFTDLLDIDTTYDIGTLLRVGLFKKQENATPLTMQIYCGVEVDNNAIYTMIQFNFQNVFIDTSQLADGSITEAKLESSLQEQINDIANKLDKRTNDGTVTELYAYNGTSQGGIGLTTAPTQNKVPYFNNNGNLKTSEPVDNNDCVNLNSMNSAISNATSYTDETYTIASGDWSAVVGAGPYTFSTTVTATYSIVSTTEVELINNNAVNFGTYGFAISSVVGQSVTLYSVGQPSASVSLKIRYRG